MKGDCLMARTAMIHARTDFASAWDHIAKEVDAKLTRDARSLKKRLLSLVDRVEAA
jgi:hypothetical protein